MQIKVYSCMLSILLLTTNLIIEIPNDVSAQVTEEWVARYNSPDSLRDFAESVTVDQWGNVYVTGKSEGPFGSGIYSDIITVAYDAAGNEMWVQKYDGPYSRHDGPSEIIVDALSGNIYVTGWSNGLGLDVDYVTLAYDQSGKELWVARYDSVYKNRDIACDIALDSFGNIYVTGSSYCYIREGGSTGFDYVTIAYNISGNELWMARYNGPGDGKDYAVGLGLDSAGNVYVFGDSSGLGEGTDLLTVAYDSSGNHLWAARYNGGYTGDWARSIVVDPAGRIYVTGDCDHGFGVNYYDIVTIAYDSSGKELWIQSYNNPSSDYDWVFDMTLTSDGNVVVTGCSRIVFGEYEFTTVAYDPLGNELWVATYQGPNPNTNSGLAITADNQGNVYITGISSGLTSNDIGTIAYDSTGNELWVFRYSGPGPSNWGIDITTDGFGNVYVTGWSYNLTTDPDFVTIKYAPIKPNIRATIDIDPNTLNLKSKGKWITCYITLNEPYDPSSIDISTILLEDTIPAEWGDIPGDRLMVKFDRSAVQALLPVGTYNLKVTGELTDGTSFEGYSDEIRVIDPGK